MEKKEKVIIWVVDNEQEYLDKAKEAIKGAFEKTEIKKVFENAEIVEWDGSGEPDQDGPKAHFIILDLNLGDSGGWGFERFERIPGVTPINLRGPFIIVWSHFEGHPDYGKLIGWDEGERATYAKNRIIAVEVKSIEKLKGMLIRLLHRYRDEGVLHKTSG